MDEKKNKDNIYKNLMLVIITALVTCIITTIVVYNAGNNNQKETNNNSIFGGIGKSISSFFTKTDPNATEVEKKITELNNKLKETYIGEIDDKKLREGALEGYVAAVGDEYTEYLTEEEINDLKEEVDGSYVGIGVYITQLLKSNEILVIGIFKDSPAEQAGMNIGDVIKKVDGIEYKGEELTVASNHMRGIEGTEVNVTVVRDGKEIELKIPRKKIKMTYVISTILENNIGYIQISSFDGNCSKEFENDYKELLDSGIKSLIIDLRNNGGGLVDQSLSIADLIVPKGSTTLITKDKDGHEEKSISYKDSSINIPIVVLVNEYTASASEILTAAIKENTNAKIVGKNTYGKGVIQGIYLLDDQKTGLKVTIQEYFTPNHNKINKTGIVPDYEVELPEEWKGKTVIEKQYDTQLNKAIELLK